MKAKKILLIFLLFSGILHILFFSQIKITFTNNQNPKISAWPDILRKKELSQLPKTFDLPKEVSFSTDKTRKAYFSNLISLPAYKYMLAENQENYFETKTKSIQPWKNKGNIYFLWNEKPDYIHKERMSSYQALLSPYGKIILFYPQQLSLDSNRSIFRHNYLKESVYCLDKKFFWTKIDILVE